MDNSLVGNACRCHSPRDKLCMFFWLTRSCLRYPTGVRDEVGSTCSMQLNFITKGLFVFDQGKKHALGATAQDEHK
jgi:hypothetical protein